MWDHREEALLSGVQRSFALFYFKKDASGIGKKKCQKRGSEGVQKGGHTSLWSSSPSSHVRREVGWDRDGGGCPLSIALVQIT